MNTTQPLVRNYSDALDILANTVRLATSFGKTPDEAMNLAAEAAVKSGHDARTRGGIWASESSAEQIEDALFMATVARDVLDGRVARPSVGNVRMALAERASRP